MIAKQEQEQYMEEEKCPWTLGNLKRTSKIGNLDASTVMYMDI